MPFSFINTPVASNTSFSGQVLLYLSKDSKSPKDEMVGAEKFPCFSITVSNIKPNDKIVFDDNAVSYPVKLSDIEKGGYNAQVARVFYADVVALLCLVVGTVAYAIG